MHIVKIILTAFMCLGFSSFGNPVRTIVSGMHTSFVANDEGISTASLYVQDGLVSLLDGIENSGWGLHGNVMRDLITGYECNIPDGWTVNQDSITATTTRGMQFTDCVIEEDFTVEYLVSFHDKNTSRECAIENLTDNKSWRFKKANYLDSWYVASICRVDLPEPYEINLYTCTYSSTENPRAHVFVNGISRASVMFTHTMAGRYGNGFRIGRNGYTSFQTVYCIRIYNRRLSDEEIAYNFYIDQMRFGL